MNKRILAMLGASIAIVFTSSATAGTITVAGSPTASWNLVTLGMLNQDGTPFFDQPSLDGPNYNIGYCLLGGGNCPVIAGVSTPLDYWGIGTNNDLNYTFSDSSKTVATFQLAVSAFVPSDALYLYDPSSPGTLHSLFNANSTPGSTVTFTAPASFGLALISGDGSTYYTQSSLNPAGETNHQHFATFDSTNTGIMYIGAEDLPGTTGYEKTGDYQDLVISLQAVSTPEPSTLLLFGGGMTALGLLKRKSNRT